MSTYRITESQLRKIISEEIETLVEADTTPASGQEKIEGPIQTLKSSLFKVLQKAGTTDAAIQQRLNTVFTDIKASNLEELPKKLDTKEKIALGEALLAVIISGPTPEFNNLINALRKTSSQ